jgi:hypothetical protein
MTGRRKRIAIRRRCECVAGVRPLLDRTCSISGTGPENAGAFRIHRTWSCKDPIYHPSIQCQPLSSVRLQISLRVILRSDALPEGGGRDAQRREPESDV